MAGNKRSSPVGSPTSGNISDSSSSKEQDRFLPIANVSRIMKRALPANAKISKEAKETVQECVSEFISFITGEASDKCQREKRKTINGDDLLWAMTTLGFENYVGPLKVYLNNYRETEGEKSNNSSSSMASTKQDDYYNHDHNSSNGGFYSQVVNDNGSKRFQEIVDYRVIGQSGGGGDETENAIASGNRIMPPNLCYRVEW
ncbi:hypothetical protein KIW84_071399 [Lathyrus oleraceus]|uniref:Transcription factor CBF/NF-Y/archaeal histone domain-containing protein n=1 Tax=Pisum sativum TaxID=3888 RepID=A0A9D4VIY3_PEA|nr:hypothetical protein KIW84_071399 [Pisum sativum]